MIFGQSNIELTHAANFRAPDDIPVKPGLIPYGVERIEILTGGEVEFGKGNSKRSYGKGTIFWHLPGEHTIHKSVPGKPYRCLNVSFRNFGTIKREYPRITNWQNSDTLKSFVDESTHGFHDPKCDRDILCAYIYSTIKWHATRSTAARDTDEVPKEIRKAVNYLNNHTESWIPVELLAERAELSKPYFQKLFKQHTGTTPHQYHLSKRIGLACEKLAYGEKTIETICFDCGFDNIESFYRAFKRIMKTSPAKYREEHSPRFWKK